MTNETTPEVMSQQETQFFAQALKKNGLEWLQ